jgi:hypothetical protein
MDGVEKSTGTRMRLMAMGDGEGKFPATESVATHAAGAVTNRCCQAARFLQTVLTPPRFAVLRRRTAPPRTVGCASSVAL